MKAIIETGGKQYNVEENSIIYVEKLDLEEGKKVIFDKILMANGVFGNPYVEGVTVEGKVLKNGKGKKITNAINEPNTIGKLKYNNVVAIYIGWRTKPYIPVSITFWFSWTSIVLDKYLFSLNTSAYKIYANTNITDEIITTKLGSFIQLYL